MQGLSKRFFAVVPAAGRGERLPGELPKQYRPFLAGRTVLEWSVAPLLEHPACAALIVVLAAGDQRFGALPVARDPRVRGTVGGAERADSVLAGLAALDGIADADDWILVHDAARPCLAASDLAKLIDAVAGDRVGGLLAVPLADTLKRAAPGDVSGDLSNPLVDGTVPREGLWRALTPQMFRFGLLRDALLSCRREGRAVTDEAAAIEALGFAPRLVMGRGDNIKITVPEDLGLAQQIVRGRAAMHEQRIGQGYDVHAYGPGDRVVLGGVAIPHDRGVVAHSDGDVLIHAVCDALLGAAALGDIGMHFPDTDPRWRGADSRQFLERVRELLEEAGLRIVNVDATVIAETPRIGKYRQQMCANLAADLRVDPTRVNVKATTTERLGYLGRREGLACEAVAAVAAAEPG